MAYTLAQLQQLLRQRLALQNQASQRLAIALQNRSLRPATPSVPAIPMRTTGLPTTPMRSTGLPTKPSIPQVTPIPGWNPTQGTPIPGYNPSQVPQVPQAPQVPQVMGGYTYYGDVAGGTLASQPTIYPPDMLVAGGSTNSLGQGWNPTQGTPIPGYAPPQVIPQVPQVSNPYTSPAGYTYYGDYIGPSVLQAPQVQQGGMGVAGGLLSGVQNGAQWSA